MGIYSWVAIHCVRSWSDTSAMRLRAATHLLTKHRHAMWLVHVSGMRFRDAVVLHEMLAHPRACTHEPIPYLAHSTLSTWQVIDGDLRATASYWKETGDIETPIEVLATISRPIFKYDDPHLASVAPIITSIRRMHEPKSGYIVQRTDGQTPESELVALCEAGGMAYGSAAEFVRYGIPFNLAVEANLRGLSAKDSNLLLSAFGFHEDCAVRWVARAARWRRAGFGDPGFGHWHDLDEAYGFEKADLLVACGITGSDYRGGVFDNASVEELRTLAALRERLTGP